MNDNTIPQVTEHLHPAPVSVNEVHASHEVSPELDAEITKELAQKPSIAVEKKVKNA